MIKLNFKRSIILSLASILVIGGVLVGAFFPTPAQAVKCPDGWEMVCCGPTCTYQGHQADYCIGTGTYCCCK
jgi:hypothetical protein